MKLFIGATQFNVPDENVLFYNESGVVSSNLTMGRVFDKMIPDDPNNFKMVDVRGVKHWYNTKYLFNPDVGKKEEIKGNQNVVKIRVEDRWYEYPDDQIVSWDSEGNIEWSDKIHWKFLRGRPQKGDEFIPSDETRFMELNGGFILRKYAGFIEELRNFLNLDIDSEISVIIPSKVLLYERNGKKIDNSDFVIRFNKSVVDGYEDYVGKKIDLLISNFQTYKSLLSGDFTSNCDRCLIATPIVVKNLEDINQLQIDYNYIKEVLKKYNFNPKQPTAGLVIILLLVELGFKNINLYGFENRRKYKYSYYYKEDKSEEEYEEESKWHDYCEENNIINRLLVDCKIKLGDDLIIHNFRTKNDTFDSIIEMIKENYYEKNSVVFLPHVHSNINIDDFREIYPGKKLIVYQIEQLYPGDNIWYDRYSNDSNVIINTQKTIDWLSKCDEIWDYDENNINFLLAEGFKNIKHKPMLYTDTLIEITDKEKDIDILFYGRINKKRADIFSKIDKKYKLKIHGNLAEDISIDLKIEKSVFRDDLKNLISRSKVIICPHFYDSNIQEQVRIFYLLINNKCVLVEESLTNYYDDMIVEFNEDNINDKIEYLIDKEGYKNYENISEKFKNKKWNIKY